MGMDFSLDIIIYALEKETENKLWEMWKLQFPNMTEENYISFEDYKVKSIQKGHKSDKTYEEIEDEMANVEKIFEGKEVKSNGII